jgi:hypothetical protein
VNADDNWLHAFGRFQEWLLSDHPGAHHERERRRLDHRVRQAQERAVLDRFADRTDASLDADDSLRHLAATARRLTARSHTEDQAVAARSDVEATLRARRNWVLGRRIDAGDEAYRYPARYLGPAAAREPIPPDPDAVAFEIEPAAALGERPAEALCEENRPSAWLRERAITKRARQAAAPAERAHPAQPRAARTRRAARTPPRSPATPKEVDRER